MVIKKRLHKLALYCAIIGFISTNSTVFANPQIESINPANYGFGGIINTHDMMMLKEKQRQMEEQEDFKNYQEMFQSVQMKKMPD